MECKEATAASLAARQAVAASMPLDDGADFANARRGFVATIPDAAIGGAWTMAPYAFLDERRPDT